MEGPGVLRIFKIYVPDKTISALKIGPFLAIFGPVYDYMGEHVSPVAPLPDVYQ